MVTETRQIRPHGVEALDNRDLDNVVAETMMGEIALTNVLFGGNAAVKFGLLQLMRGICSSGPLSILDVGAGGGEVVSRACGLLGEQRTHPVALDHHRTSAHMCSARGVTPIVGDLRQLPLGPASIDIAIVSLVLHHVTRTEAVALVAQLDAVARLGVVIADLRRSTLARIGFDLAGRILRLHEGTRRDGLLSIQRGFTVAELNGIITDAGVTDATVRRRPGWRVVAYWRTNHEDN
ncbi:MAG: methyltransferase domain-containing protein [Gemmatimonadota bacterium]|nr:MAG: methyltransferase domain-containing protein [Gemmatimonadota bacterium]